LKRHPAGKIPEGFCSRYSGRRDPDIFAVTTQGVAGKMEGNSQIVINLIPTKEALFDRLK
jgi:hypothetical protein